MILRSERNPGQRSVAGRLLRQHLNPGLNRRVQRPDAIQARLHSACVPREAFSHWVNVSRRGAGAIGSAPRRLPSRNLRRSMARSAGHVEISYRVAGARFSVSSIYVPTDRSGTRSPSPSSAGVYGRSSLMPLASSCLQNGSRFLTSNPM